MWIDWSLRRLGDGGGKERRIRTSIVNEDLVERSIVVGRIVGLGTGDGVAPSMALGVDLSWELECMADLIESVVMRRTWGNNSLVSGLGCVVRRIATVITS
jgi:hypothetical protein